MTGDPGTVPNRHSSFVIRHSLDIRHSSFDIPPRRGAFTLVELMVVIVIIIILMGLLTPVLINVMAKAREARISAEIAAMDGAFKAYKERFGSYPPSDFGSTTGQQLIALHLAHAFPRCNVQTELAAINAAGGSGITAAQALVFWLSGFTADPEHPLSGHYTVSGVNGYTTPSPPLPLSSFFSFDAPRLLVNGTAAQLGNSPVPVYTPADGLGSPYVYFAAQDYATQSAFTASSASQGGTGVCRPYFSDSGSNTNGQQFLYVNPNSYQIISAGLDGDFGEPSQTTPANQSPYFPSGNGLSQADLDNLTNFSQGNLKDATPH